MGEREHRKKRLTPEQKVADRLCGVANEHHRRRGLPAVVDPATPAASDPAVCQGRVHGRVQGGPDRPKRDPNLMEVEQELHRTNEPARGGQAIHRQAPSPTPITTVCRSPRAAPS